MQNFLLTVSSTFVKVLCKETLSSIVNIKKIPEYYEMIHLLCLHLSEDEEVELVLEPESSVSSDTLVSSLVFFGLTLFELIEISEIM